MALRATAPSAGLRIIGYLHALVRLRVDRISTRPERQSLSSKPGAGLVRAQQWAAGPPSTGVRVGGLAIALLALLPLVGCRVADGEPPPTAPVLVIVTPTPTFPATPPPLVNRTYVVQEGDTLSGVAAMFGTSEDAIVAANGLGDRDQLFAGQSIVVPVPVR